MILEIVTVGVVLKKIKRRNDKVTQTYRKIIDLDQSQVTVVHAVVKNHKQQHWQCIKNELKKSKVKV